MPRARVSSDRAFDAQLGQRIRQRRIALGLAQSEIAARVGVSFQQVQKYEKGVNRISGARLTALAAILRVDPSWFFEANDAPAGDERGDRLLLEHQRRFAALPKDLQLAIDNLTRHLAGGFGERRQDS